MPALLRLVSLLAAAGSECPWLLEELAAPEVVGRLRATFDVLGEQGALSWYNR